MGGYVNRLGIYHSDLNLRISRNAGNVVGSLYYTDQYSIYGASHAKFDHCRSQLSSYLQGADYS